MDDHKYKYFFIEFIFILLSLMIINKPAYAKDLSYVSSLYNQDKYDYKEYSFGIEGITNFVAPKEDWSSVFRSEHYGFKFFMGYNWENIMFELGYMTTIKNGKEFAILAGDQMFGLTNDLQTTINSSSKLKQTYFDINVFHKIFKNLDIITSLGISFTRPYICITSSDPMSIIGNKLINVLPKTSRILRAGFGLYYYYSTSIGFRAMWHFDQYSKVTLRQADPALGRRPFKDAYTISAGVLFKM